MGVAVFDMTVTPFFTVLTTGEQLCQSQQPIWLPLGIFTAVATAIWWFMEDDKTTVTVTKESQS